MIRVAIAVMLSASTAGVVMGQSADLAPTGTVRMAFLATNPVHGRMDPKTGAVTGLIADLTRELAARLKTPFMLIPAPDASALIRQVNAGNADVGFLAYDAGRAREVDFVAGVALMFNTYVVPSASPLRSVSDVDRAGIEIGAVKGQSPQIFLSENIKQARMHLVETTPPQAELERVLGNSELSAFALNRQRAEEAAAASKGRLRALTGSFFDVEQSFVVKKGETAKAAALRAFVDELKASGFIKKSIDRAKLVGVAVAK
jgi:polar amino acid transport system substrate-binding protein